MTDMKRRDLLKLAAAAPFALTPWRLLAAGEASARLLVVFLRGGYDSASLLVPIGSSLYYEARPYVAIAAPGTGPQAALRLDSDWGLHPALAGSLLPLYEKGEIAFIAFAGTEHLSRSHFETQDVIERGQPEEGRRVHNSGFLNRLASILAGRSQPIAFTDRLPLAFRGETQVANVALRQFRKPSIDPVQTAVIAKMYQNTALASAVNEGFSLRDGVAQELSAEMEAASRNAISARGFELEARRIARLMRGKFNVGFVDIGGWDTHVGQGAATGYLATRLEELGRGLSAFASEMGERWQDTVTVVVSEFGRTFRENGSRGTDHGHGTVYWVAGGGIRGGRIAGEQVTLQQGTLHQNRDYAVLNEYRAVLGGLFSRMYGFGSAELERVFAGVQPRDLQLL
jgi:uncharacterized protein (DUF1501 family)